MDKTQNKTNFNIYYLNISKVYEIKMMIDNVIVSRYEKEKISEKRKDRKLSLNSNNVPNLGVGLGIENFTGETTKFNEHLEVKNTKSTYLKNIIHNCHNVKTLSNCKEGNLVKIDEVSLEFLDEEMQRIISLIQKDIFKGIKVDDYEVNNMISSVLADYPYFLKGNITNSKDDKGILIKIPIENKTEFESKYTVNDLLIGNISIIGIYKGEVNEKDLKKTNIDYFAEKDNSKPIFDKVEPSSTEQTPSLNDSNSKKENFHFIDVIAIVQDVNFLKNKKKDEKISRYHKIINFLLRRDK